MALPVPYPETGHIQQNTSRGFRRDLWVPSSFDYTLFEDTFWGDTLHTLYPAAKVNNGTVVFTEHNKNGFLEFKTSSSNDGYAGQGLGLQLTGDRGILFDAVVKLPSTITAFKFEVGLSDADDDAGAVNVKATPSHTATDYAVFILDSDENSNLDFMSDGASIAAQETTGLLTLAASDVLRFSIRVNGNNLQAYVNGVKVAEHSEAIEGGNTLTPWVFVQTRDTAENILELSKWRVIQPAY